MRRVGLSASAGDVAGNEGPAGRWCRKGSPQLRTGLESRTLTSETPLFEPLTVSIP